eukprot:TRINITY_DN3360_c0_g1_i2.p1 TRINITY_DN3360_c0_g1~~TRINITY_DN3360_c0_g1_i2.p1  ORF type:complete len:3862 (+),score=680.04 TRINITY_DN3360_c0_g1_i2:906-11588(+)
MYTNELPTIVQFNLGCPTLISGNSFTSNTGSGRLLTLMTSSGSVTSVITLSNNTFSSNTISRTTTLILDSQYLTFGGLIAVYDYMYNYGSIVFSNNTISNNFLTGGAPSALLSFNCQPRVSIVSNIISNNRLTPGYTFPFQTSILWVVGYPSVKNNSFVNPTFGYEVWNYNKYDYAALLDLSSNYFGVTSGPSVKARIFHFGNDLASGLISWSPFYDSPSLSSSITDTSIAIVGSLSSSVTWTLSGSPYYITNIVTIEPDAVLTIMPGVQVLFQPGAGFLVQGVIMAIGTSSERINFSSALSSPVPGSWGSVRIESNWNNYPQSNFRTRTCATQGEPTIINDETLSYTLPKGDIANNGVCNIFEYTSFSYGGAKGGASNLGMIGNANQFSLSSLVIGHSTFSFSGGNAVDVQFSQPYSSVFLYDNTFTQNMGRGVATYFATLISGNMFSYNNLGGLFVNAQRPSSSCLLVNNTIDTNGNNSLSCESNPGMTVACNNVQIFNNKITRNACGESAYGALELSSSYLSSGNITNNIIAHNRIYFGVRIYHNYDSSKLYFRANTITNNTGIAALRFSGFGEGSSYDWQSSSPVTPSCSDVLLYNDIRHNIYGAFTPVFGEDYQAAVVMTGRCIMLNNNTIQNPNYLYEAANGNVYPSDTQTSTQAPVDGRFNYWGTGTVGNIKQRIRSGPPYAFIDYSPYLTAKSTPVEYYGGSSSSLHSLSDPQYGVSGVLSSNTTWSGPTPIMVSSYVFVPFGVVLTIAPGTTVYFNRGASIIVAGVLNAQGTSTSRIVFSSMTAYMNNNGSAGDWGQLRFLTGSPVLQIRNFTYDATTGVQNLDVGPTSSGSILSFCDLRYGGSNGIPMMSMGSNTAIVIMSSSFINSTGACYYASLASLQIFGSTFSGCSSGVSYVSAVYMSGGLSSRSSIVFANNIVKDNRGQPLMLSAGSSVLAYLVNNTFVNNGYAQQLSNVISWSPGLISLTDRNIFSFGSSASYPLYITTTSTIDPSNMISNNIIDGAMCSTVLSASTYSFVNNTISNCVVTGNVISLSSVVFALGNTFQNNTAGTSFSSSYAYAVLSVATPTPSSQPTLSVLPKVSYNLFTNPTSQYDLAYTNYFYVSDPPLDASLNFWGSSNQTKIASRIYDFSQNSAYDPVTHVPYWRSATDRTPVNPLANRWTGTLANSTTWSPETDPHVSNTLIVPEGITLTILPGTTVTMLASSSILVQKGGVIIARGTSSSSPSTSISFVSGSDSPQPGDWYSIQFGVQNSESSSSTGTLSSCPLLSYPLPNDNVLPPLPSNCSVFEHVQFSNGGGVRGFVYAPSLLNVPIIKDCSFTGGKNGGIDVDITGTPSNGFINILNNRFINCGPTGYAVLQVSVLNLYSQVAAAALVANNFFENNLLKLTNLRVANLTLVDNIFTNNPSVCGFSASTASAYIANNRIINNTISSTCTQKQSSFSFGGPSVVFINNTIVSNTMGYLGLGLLPSLAGIDVLIRNNIFKNNMILDGGSTIQLNYVATQAPGRHFYTEIVYNDFSNNYPASSNYFCTGFAFVGSMTPDVFRFNNLANPNCSVDIHYQIVYSFITYLDASYNYFGAYLTPSKIPSRVSNTQLSGSYMYGVVTFSPILASYPLVLPPLDGGINISSLNIVEVPRAGYSGILTPAQGESTVIWTPSSSPYYVSSIFTVPLGVTLVLQPGTRVLFNTGANMVVKGNLVAQGTYDAPISFSSLSRSAGSWGGIVFMLPPATNASTCNVTIQSNGEWQYQGLINPTQNASLPFGCSVFSFCTFSYGGTEYLYNTIITPYNDYQQNAVYGMVTVFADATSPNNAAGGRPCDATPGPIILNSIFSNSATSAIAANPGVGPLVIRDNTLSFSGYTGAQIRSPYGPTLVYGNTISNNKLGGLVLHFWTSLQTMSPCYGVYVLDNLISFNIMRATAPAGGSGNFYYQAAGLTLYYYFPLGSWVIKNNVIEENNNPQTAVRNHGGVYLNTNVNGDFSHNYILYNIGEQSSALSLQFPFSSPAHVTIDSNIIVGNKANNRPLEIIVQSSSSSVEFSYNHVVDNIQYASEAAIYTIGYSVTLNHNTFVNSELSAEIGNSLSGTLDVTNNFWGDDDDRKKKKRADALSRIKNLGATGTVLYQPELTEPVANAFIRPSVTAISPSIGQASGSVIINVYGTNFLNTTWGTIMCAFGKVHLPVYAYFNTTMIQCLSPSSAPGPIPIDVSIDGGILFSRQSQGIYTAEGAPAASYMAPGVIVEFEGVSPTMKVTALDSGEWVRLNFLNLLQLPSALPTASPVLSYAFPDSIYFSFNNDTSQVYNSALGTNVTVQRASYTTSSFPVADLSVTIEFLFPSAPYTTSYGVNVAYLPVKFGSIMYTITISGWTPSDPFHYLALETKLDYSNAILSTSNQFGYLDTVPGSQLGAIQPGFSNKIFNLDNPLLNVSIEYAQPNFAINVASGAPVGVTALNPEEDNRRKRAPSLTTFWSVFPPGVSSVLYSSSISVLPTSLVTPFLSSAATLSTVTSSTITSGTSSGGASSTITGGSSTTAGGVGITSSTTWSTMTSSSTSGSNGPAGIISVGMVNTAGSILTITGYGFVVGDPVSVSISGHPTIVASSCSVLNATVILCNVSPGTGASISFTLSMPGFVTSSQFSYYSPRVASASWGILTNSSLYEQTTNSTYQSILITGSNFGTDSSIIFVDIAAVVCTRITLLRPHTLISCYVDVSQGTASLFAGHISVEVDSQTNLDNNMNLLSIQSRDIVLFIDGPLVVTSELGKKAFFGLSLPRVPLAPVTVRFTSDDPSAAVVVPGFDEAVFTQQNWNKVLTIAIAGTADANKNTKNRNFAIAGQVISADASFSSSVSLSIPGVSRNIVWPNVLQPSPSLIPKNGSLLVQLYGAFFQQRGGVVIGGNNDTSGSGDDIDGDGDGSSSDVPIVRVADVDVDAIRVSSNELQFMAPPLPQGYTLPAYVPIHVINPDGGYMSCPGDAVGGPGFLAGVPRCLQQHILYYTADCRIVGQWGKDTCMPCPVGGFCPGGYRVWPLPTYWNPFETVVPGPCWPPFACPGHDRVPKCGEGYKGDYCSLCSEGYYRSGIACTGCSNNPPSRFVPVLLTAVVFFGAIAIAAVVLNDTKLDTIVGLLLSLQQLISIGNSASAYISQGAQNLFSGLSWVLFDYTWINPGCYLPSITYVQVWGGTIVCVLVFMAMFAFVAFLRARLMKAFLSNEQGLVKMEATVPKPAAGRNATLTKIQAKVLAIVFDAQLEEDDDTNATRMSIARKEKEDAVSWTVILRRRMVRCWVILFTVVYLIVTTRTLQGMNCIDINDTKRLFIERTIICYTGQHLVAAPFLWLVFFLYCIGFPAFCTYVVLLAHRQHRTRKYALSNNKFNNMIGYMKPAFADMFGFLWRDLRYDVLWFRLVPLGINLIVAFQQAFGLGIATQLLVNYIIFAADFLVGCWLWPYQLMRSNLIMAVSGFAKAIVILALLNNLREDTPYGHIFFIVAIVFFFVAVVAALIIRCILFKRSGTGPFAKKQQKMQKVTSNEKVENDDEEDRDDDDGDAKQTNMTVELDSLR